jgi:two-component system sensor histidine kinase ChiS
MRKRERRPSPQCAALLIFLTVTICLTLTGCGSPAGTDSGAVRGALDLTDVDFSAHAPVKLDGAWEFYWGALLTPEDFKSAGPAATEYISVPKSWNGYVADGKKLDGYGCATYRLLISVRSGGMLYGLKFLPMGTAYKLWVNGELLSSNGIVGASKEESRAQYFTRQVCFNSSRPQIELIVQISNFQHQKGGFWYSPLLGSAEQIEKSVLEKAMLDAFIFGALFLFFIYHISLFLLRRKDRSTLYFALFCLTVAIRSITFNEYPMTRLLPGLPWDLVVKTEYLSLFFIAPIALAFFSILLPGSFHKKLVRAVQAVSLLACAFVAVTPPAVFSYIIDYYIYFTGACMAYILFALVSALRSKTEGALIILIGYVVLMATGVNDIIAKFTGVNNTALYFSLGLFIFTFMQSYMLSRRFSNAFYNVEKLSGELQEYSRELEDKNYKLERVNRIKDEFLANTTHELKTPLHGIIGVAESVLENAGNLTANQGESLKLIALSARRLSGLVNDILDHSKLKHHDISLKIKPVDPWKITEAVISLLKPLASVKGLTLKNNIPEDVPLMAADAERFRQIMQNLIENAVKYTDDGGIVVSAAPEGDFLEISVADTGPGIPEDRLSDIFKPFEQLNLTEDAGMGGIGLGLSITKKLVELHGGGISVRPGLPRGSVFEISIPLFGGGTVTETGARTGGGAAAGTDIIQVQLPEYGCVNKSAPTILIADDEPVNLLVMLRIFSEEDCNIITATDGQDALDKALAERPDLVILDCMMPRMSGLEVCRKIREKHSLYDMPILIVTVINQSDDIQAGFEAGANDYLAKPFDIKELKARASTLLEIRRSVNQAIIAEYSFLQAQIKPHFLYNALNSIMALCRINPEKAREMLYELSNYLRGSFDFKNTDSVVPVEKELNIIRSYLIIEKERFGDRLLVEYNIDENVRVAIPPLILQPIVENAVLHGISKKPKGGTVRISIRDTDQTIQFSVADNGTGMDRETAAAVLGADVKEPGPGVGLRNIDRRLKTIYGAGLDIRSEIGIGTTVTFNIPR